MMTSNLLPPKRLLLIGCFVVLVVAAFAILTSHSSHTASADTVSSVGLAPADEPVLQSLQREHPSLNLGSARVVVSDSTGTVWRTDATNGEVCLVEKPAPPADTTGPYALSRFSCQAASTVAAKGMVAGVPGHWYGVTTQDKVRVTAVASGQAVAVDVQNGAFRLPTDATEVAFGDAAPQPLPGSGH
jgi:hypothetical protein